MKISLVQTDLIWEDKQQNLAQIRRLVDTISDPQDLIVLPEMFSTGFTMEPAGLAEETNGATFHWMQQLASETNALIAGSLIISDQGKYFNRFLAVSPKGLVSQYDKRHLFRMAGEETAYTKGQERVVFSWRGWRILPQICYDIRFPVWIRNRQDYDLALFVANWPEPRRDVWLTLLKARALENQVYIAGVNRIGIDGKGNNHVGDSMVLDPKGQVLTEAGSESRVISANLSLEELIRFREKFQVALDQDQFEITL